MWGSGGGGLLGNNSTLSTSSPVQTVSQGTNWKQIGFGRSVNQIATKTDGTLWIWGCGFNGQLGDNSTISQSIPIQTASQATNWTRIGTDLFEWCSFATTNYHTAAIKVDGTLWVWGLNSSGQLGNNSCVDRCSPTQTISQGNNWKQTSTGVNNTAAIKVDGTLWLWGSGVCGKLGNNSTVNVSSPVQTVSQGTNWLQVAMASCHAAAIKTDGTLWLWGSGACGKLGSNSTDNQSSPIQTISQGTDWQQVSSQDHTTAALKTDGTLWLWGLNSSGQLGDESTTNKLSPVQTIAQGTDWKQVSINSSHTAAVKNDGTLWVWGNGVSGKLGNSSTINVSSPVQTITTGNNWKQVSVGKCHTTAVKTDGTLWLWGSNVRGQLGDTTGLNQSSPVQTITSGTNWNQVSAGENHTVALDFTDQLEVWGDNTKGQLGCDRTVYSGSIVDLGVQYVEKDYLIDVYPNLTTNIKTPSLWGWGNNASAKLGINSTISQSSPVQTVSTGTNWKQVSSGSISTSSGIKTDGTLWMWGCAIGGNMGNNSTINRSSPVQTVSTGTNWKQVSVGSGFSSAVKTDGTLWLWGCGFAGVMGNNSSINRSSPVQTVSTGTNWKQVSTGYTHISTLKTDGTLWIWGQGVGGTLGNNSTINRSSPVQTVSTGTNWKQVSVGFTHTAAVKTDGTLWIWGCGTSGTLGDNSTTAKSSPVQTVSQGIDWKQVASGCNNSIGIKTDGTLWLWGLGSSGQLGDNSTTAKSSPVQTVSTGTNWKCISSGYTHSAAIKTDGTLWLWGCNVNGQIGANSVISQSSPVQTVSQGTNWKQVSSGCDHTFSIKEDYDW